MLIDVVDDQIRRDVYSIGKFDMDFCVAQDNVFVANRKARWLSFATKITSMVTASSISRLRELLNESVHDTLRRGSFWVRVRPINPADV